MKLFRFGAKGQERPGVVPRGWNEALDVSEFGQDWGQAFFERDGLDELESWLEKRKTNRGHGSSELDAVYALPVVNLHEERLGPVVTRPSKIIGVGMNYQKHVEETGGRVPPEPKLFMKATTAVSGVDDELQLPRRSERTDYEVELALVIGRRASYVEEPEALQFVAGYTICNDYSERDFQINRGGQFVKGKSADGFCPLGPFLVTDRSFDPHAAELWLDVNGQRRQHSSSADMIFSVAGIVSCVSQYMTLLPGDVITTGTPSGVGLGRQPPEFLQHGDVVEYGIEGIGRARQRVVAVQSL